MRAVDVERVLPPEWFVVSEPRLLSVPGKRFARTFVATVAHPRRGRGLCLVRERDNGTPLFFLLESAETAALGALLAEMPSKTPANTPAARTAAPP